MGRSLDSRFPILLRAVSPRGEPDPIEAPADNGSGRIVFVDNAVPESLVAAAARLAPDGLLAVSGSPRALHRARRTFPDERLADRGTWLRSDRALVHASQAGRALLVEQSVLSGSRRLALRLAPSVLAPRLALFTRRDGPPPLAWLDPGAGAGAVVASHRSPSVAVRLAHGNLFAKWTTEVERVEGAHERESSLAAGARAAGFDVPESRVLQLGTASALVAEARSGETAASQLRRRPGDLASLADRLVSTIEAWNLRSGVPKPFGGTQAARQLATDLEVVAPYVDAGDLQAARRRIEDASAEVTPVSPAHGDVSMWNVIVTDGLTLVDWEDAVDEMLSGFDAEYALVDAAAAASSYVDRVSAFSSSDVAGLRRRLAATTGQPPPVAALAPVACWAHHAANEIRRGGDDTSFLAILRLVLAGPTA